MPSTILATIDRLKRDLDALPALPPEVAGRVEQKLRIESNYHSNALEGNTLTLAETRSLLLHGLTARGKPMREHVDIEGYDRAVKELTRMASDGQPLSESFIRNLHRVLLKEPYEVETVADDGRNTRRPIAVGAYKSADNNIVTSTGETYYFTPPEQVPHAMGALVDWYHGQEADGEHPIIIAAVFHYRFVRIHPFDDGNGRMARLLMNRILLGHGYPLAIVRRDTRDRYLQELERADRTEDPGEFIDYIASCCEYSLNLYLRAARGEPLEDSDEIDREIALFRQALVEGDGTPDHVHLRRHTADVVLPFQSYCRAKFRALTRDLFSPGTESLPQISGHNADGRHFRVARVTVADRVPEQASDAAIEFGFSCVDFKDTDWSITTVIRNTLRRRQCEWELLIFYVSPAASDFSTRCESADLDELRSAFNRLLRDMMRTMDQWDSQAGS
ncbi:MAG: Fic family protein [Spirochaetaceae bacterium]|nr:Fic family protein [Spirochaetaceae bacterium]